MIKQRDYNFLECYFTNSDNNEDYNINLYTYFVCLSITIKTLTLIRAFQDDDWLVETFVVYNYKY